MTGMVAEFMVSRDDRQEVMQHELSLLLVGLLCGASLFAWGYALSGAVRISTPVWGDSPECSPAPPISVALGLAAIAFLLVGPAIELLERVLGWESAPMREITLRDVQIQFAFNLVVWIVLVASLGHPRHAAAALGLDRAPPARQLLDAIVGFHLAIGPVFAVLLVSELAGLRGEQPVHKLLLFLLSDGSAANWAWIALTAVVAAPLLEELLFRVLLQGCLERFVPAAAAIAVSSIVFAIVHDFPDSLALLPLAVVLGWMYSRTRSYLTIVGIHSLFNAVNLLMTALSDGDVVNLPPQAP